MPNRVDVLCVFGTRPEAIKLVSVVSALRKAGVATAVLATGQHTTLLDPAVVRALDVTASLQVPSDDHPLHFVTRASRKLRAYLAESPARCVLVQGDTMSGFVGAMVAHELELPVAHVEAGVRSHNMKEPWPEELTRIAIDAWATWRYAPTAIALAALRLEGLDGVVTGNTSIDVLQSTGVIPRAEVTPTLLVTLHRRELRTRPDALAVLQAMCESVAAAHIDTVWPVHPAMEALAVRLTLPPTFVIRPPFAYGTMLRVLSEARGLLTDSGGLVEEAAALGVPTAILRNANDRPEAVDALIAQQFAVTPESAYAAVQLLASARVPRIPCAAYGDGRAGERIAAHLAEALRAH